MISARLRIVVPASKRKEVLQALCSLRGPTEAHRGCGSCRAYQDAEDENAFLLLQDWHTKDALARYIRSDLYRTILAVMESAREPPELRFDTIAETAGVEVVRVARGVTEATEKKERR
jgi:quinol monooxygenase YgiN